MHRAVRGLDNGGDYPDAVYLAIGSGAAPSSAMLQRLEAALAKQAGPDHPATSAGAFQAVEADLTGGSARTMPRSRPPRATATARWAAGQEGP